MALLPPERPVPGAQESARSGDRSGNQTCSTSRIASEVLCWVAGLTACLVLLSGRYSFAPEVARFSWRGYLSSAYLLVITLPALYYLSRRFLKKSFWPRMITATTALVFTLPYRWLGLDRFFYHRDRPVTYPIDEPPDFAWLPGGYSASMPFELTFYLALAAVGGTAIWWLARGRNPPSSARRRAAWLWLGVYGLILLQSWLHLSMRNPQVYTTALARHEKHADNNYFSLTYLLEDAQGAASRDYHVFRQLEEHFMGLPKETSTLVIRRAFPLYVTSQLSYFVSPFYVFLATNIVLWLLSAVAAFRFARPIRGPRIAGYFAFLVACAPGFIAFSTSPRTYLASYALIILLIYLFETLLVRRGTRGDFFLFGAILGLGALVYDIFSLLVLLVGLALLRRLPPLRTAAVFALGLGIYAGFLWVQFGGLGLEPNERNSRILTDSVANIGAMISRFDPGEIYVKTAVLPQIYFGDLSQAFFVLPLVLAVAGAFLIRDRSQIALILLLGLPSLLNIAFLHYGGATFGGKEMAKLPRLAFTAYPAVYLLAAIALDEARRCIRRALPGAPVRYLPWLVLAALFILGNADVFGFPEAYYLFNKYLGMSPVRTL